MAHIRPTHTQFPDDFLDFWMAELTDAEWRCLCYIVRHTIGYKKDIDGISFKQFLHGIHKFDGTCVDKGTGVKSASTLAAGLAGLERRGLIDRTRNTSAQRGKESTSYRLVMDDDAALNLPLAAVAVAAPSLPETPTPTTPDEVGLLRQAKMATTADGVTLLRQAKIQKTTYQKTTRQETSNKSGAAPPPRTSASPSLVSTEHDDTASQRRILALALAREVFGSKTSTERTLARYEAFMSSLLDAGYSWDDLWSWMFWLDSGRRYWRGKSRIFCAEQMLKDLTDWDASGKPQPIPESACVPYYKGRRLDTAAVVSREAAGQGHTIEWRSR